MNHKTKRPSKDRVLSRQSQVFPDRRRQQTAIVECGVGAAATMVSTLLKAAAAAAGIQVVSDDDGPQDSASHPLLGPHQTLVREFSGQQMELDYHDVQQVVDELRSLVPRYPRTECVLYVNHPRTAHRVAAELAAGKVEVPLLLVLVGRAGVIIERSRPAEACARLECLCGIEAIQPGPAEFALLAAGAVLGEVMLAQDEDAPAAIGSGLVLGYSVNRPRRIDLPSDAPWSEYVDELTKCTERICFRGKRLVQIGAGGLAHPADVALALDTPSELFIWDADTVGLTNLNRQFLFREDDIGQSKSRTLSAALQAIDPSGGVYRGVPRFVEQPSDLEPLEAAALVVLPDNDRARFTGAEAAWTHRIPMATAASTATSGYVAVQQPGRACLGCLLGDRRGDLDARESCASVEEDQIVSTNMVLAALAISELRMALSGEKAVNLRYSGRSAVGNRLRRMVSDPPCTHR